MMGVLGIRDANSVINDRKALRDQVGQALLNLGEALIKAGLDRPVSVTLNYESFRTMQRCLEHQDMNFLEAGSTGVVLAGIVLDRGPKRT